MGLSAGDLARLTPEGRVEHHLGGDLTPLDGPALAIVLEGCLRVFRHAAFVRDVTLGLARAGDVLGPAALFGGRSGETGAEALGPARILLVAPEAVDAAAAEDPGLYLRLARGLGARTRRVQARLEAVSRATVEQRVAAALLEIAGEEPPFPGARLELPLSQEDLARLAATTRESASSTVAALARRGLVRGRRLNGLVLVDPAALAAIADAG